MFTGLIEEVGTVRSLDPGAGTGSLAIGCSVVTEGTSIGDSIAVNGVCLTVTDMPGDGFVVEVMGETFDRSSIGGLSEGERVNLERAMLAGDRLGGHMVQGHVDGVGEILSLDPQGEWTTVTYRLPAHLARYVVEKGSITVDGTSLTVMAVTDDSFSVGLIPHTMAVTTHGDRAVGDRVNLEVDVIAKYVERQLAAHMERQLTAGATSPYTTSPTASAST